MADGQTQEQHSPICRAAAEKKALLEGYRFGTSHGFDEAMAVVKDLPPEASAADALKVLADHREVWQSVAGMSANVLAANIPISSARQGPEREG